jgi:S-disulfanyl-L-cysteine oxidoreductase SoxD
MDQGVAVQDVKVPALSQQHWPESFGWGKRADVKDIKAWDIDVRPDGKGLPEGSGTVAQGQKIYAAKCQSCHGDNNTNAAYARLYPPAIPDSGKEQKLIGNYWPYATTLYDYINRAMPFNEPGSLSAAEVYSLTAYLLNKNDLWPEQRVIDRYRLPKVQMPAHDRFINDDRKGGAEIR